MQRVSHRNMQAQMMGGGWEVPASCKRWYSSTLSGAVASPATWPCQMGIGPNLIMQNGATVDANGFNGNGVNQQANAGGYTGGFQWSWNSQNSACVWVYPSNDVSATGQRIIWGSHWGWRNGWSIYTVKGSPNVAGFELSSDSSTNREQVQVPIPAFDQWIHIAVTRIGASPGQAENIIMYVNGVPTETTIVYDAGYSNPNCGAICIGGRYGVGAYHWWGYGDEMMAFNAALTAEEVAALYANPYTKA